MKKISSFILSIILILANLLIVNMLIAPIGVNNNAAAFPGGNGSPGNPFQIANVTDLQNISANLSAHYILINDIDASNTTYWNSGAGFNPIGTIGTKFTGTFDGKGFKIFNLTINRSGTNYIGLFGVAGAGSIFKNVSLINVNITGQSNVAGLIGNNLGGKIYNSYATGLVTGTNSDVGGLVGYTEDIFAYNSSSSAEIIGDDAVGGLVGTFYNGTIDYCYSIGNVICTTKDTGGFAGYVYINANINNSYASGDINCSGDDAGGFSGHNYGTISNSSALGNVYGYGDYIGGFIGYNTGGSITDCVSWGNLYGNGSDTEDSGGFIGWNQGGDITNCISYGYTTAKDWDLGGFIGVHSAGLIYNCTVYGDTDGWRLIGGLIGQMNGGSVEDCVVYGNVTGTNEYLGGLIGYIDDGTVTDSIAYGGVTGTGSPGNYVGGLIGQISGSIPVNYCTAYGDATGTADYVGGLIGYNSGGKISDCTADGNATGPTDEVGGLIGESSAGGSVINCTAYGNAFGDNDVGGLIGLNFGPVTNCTVYGDATGTADGVGGLIGWNYGDVDNCSSYGDANGIGVDSGEIGGLMGYNDVKKVENCVSYGSAAGPTEHIGGLIGENKGPVTKCVAFGAATGATDYIGGLIGWNDGGTITISAAFGNATGNTSSNDFVGGLIGYNTGGLVENCYSHGNATGNVSVGGLIGNNSGLVNSSYSIGYVSGDTNIGGLIGFDSGTVIASFWDNLTSGQTTSAGGANATGKNTTEMQKEATFTGAGWNFSGIWAIIEGKTYPYFGNWYNPPQIVTADVKSATEDALYSVDYDAYLPSYPPENYIESWTLTTNASGWLAIDANGLLAGTPTNNDLGSYWVNVTVTDFYGGIDTHNFTLTVINTNDPPSITTPDNITAIEDLFYSVVYQASDPDPTNDDIYWNYTTNASWLGFNKVTAELLGMPLNNHVGTYWVNITVHDDKNSMNFTNFTLTVVNVNNNPKITTLDNLTAYEDMLYSEDYEAYDIDPTMDTFAWSLATNSTSNWLSIVSTTGLLIGTPSNDDVGTIWVNVTVKDGNNGVDFSNFTLTILNVNDDPQITTTDQHTATEDVLYSVDYDVTDEDLGNVHKWILSTNASWLNLDDSTGVLSGTPTNNDVGTYWVNVTVDDWNEGIDRHNFTLTVINVNDPPYITTTDVTTATEDELYSVDYNATDIDPTFDILSWSLVTNAEWLSINSITGMLTGTPTNDDVDTFWANVSVNDGNGGEDSQNFSIIVSNVNDPPEITTTDVTTATAGEFYSMDYNATDIDPTNDILVWSLDTGAGWLSLNPSTGLLLGAPSEDDVGDYSVDVTVSDSHGGSDTNSFTLTVEPGVVITNLAPEIITTDVTTANVDISYSVTYQATDDRTAVANLTWTMATDANWLNFDTSTNVLTGTPTLSDIGNFWVLVTVNDGEEGTDSTNFTITVTGPAVNTKPVLTNGKMSPASGDTDTKFTFSVHYQDADGDAPATIKVVIDGTDHALDLKSGDAADGTYTYTAKLSKGAHTFYFSANDGTDDAVSSDGTPTSIADTETTTEIEEAEEKGAFEDWMLYLIIIIIIIIIIALVALVMSRRKGAPLTEESFFAAEEEELEAEEELMDKEEMTGDEESGEGSEDKTAEDTFECPTCGAELKADDTVCPECGEEFED